MKTLAERLSLLSGQRLKPKYMTDEQQIAIGANLTFIVLCVIYLFISVFH